MPTSSPSPSPSPLRERLRSALGQAMKAGDRPTVSVLRSTLSAIDNSEAVAPEAPTHGDSEVVAGAVLGLGAAERPRRALSDDEIATIVEGEITELLEAAATYESAGRPERAEPLRSGAAVLRAALTEASGRQQ